MSRLARIVAPVAMLAVMSIGGVAHAQDPGSSSSGASAPGATPGSATAAPKPIPVTTNRWSGQAGATVRVSANVRGCAQPGSARGEFIDHVGAVRPLADQVVTWNARFTARFDVNSRDVVGWGKVKVVCDAGLPTATQGYAEFWVAPVPGKIAVWITPTAGGPGTVVTVRADVRGDCDPFYAFFEDGKGRHANLRDAPSLRSRDRQVVGQYTITGRDAVGRGRVGVSCNATTDYFRIGYASFWVRAAGGTGRSSGGRVSGGSTSGGVTVNRDNGKIQLPSEIDTGLGGTADGSSQGRDPAWLLLPAGLLLITAGVGISLRQASRRRR
jgi:hypothetical protein